MNINNKKRRNGNSKKGEEDKGGKYLGLCGDNGKVWRRFRWGLNN